MTKQSIDLIADNIAREVLAGSKDVNSLIRIEKNKSRLNDEQISRLCEQVNHKLNAAYMNQQPYTHFELADPSQASEIKPDYSFLEDSGKYASVEKKNIEQEEQFYKLSLFFECAKNRGVDVLLRFDDGDGDSVLKAASELSLASIEKVSRLMLSASERQQLLYKAVKKEISKGVSLSAIQEMFKAKREEKLFNQIVPLLKKEGLIGNKHIEDAGPYSVPRMLKRAEEDKLDMGIAIEDYRDVMDKISEEAIMFDLFTDIVENLSKEAGWASSLLGGLGSGIKSIGQRLGSRADSAISGLLKAPIDRKAYAGLKNVGSFVGRTSYNAAKKLYQTAKSTNPRTLMKIAPIGATGLAATKRMMDTARTPDNNPV